MALLIAGGVFADYWSAKPLGITPEFVGRDSCVACHQEQAEAFAGSDHDKAMDLATEETVLGDFDNVTFEHDGLSNRLFRDGDRFMVHTDGEDGRMQDFEVKYVFGVYPLQQYMVEFDSDTNAASNQSGDEDAAEACEIGRLQVLRITWDSRNNRWFYLRPPDVAEKLAADDPLHWTGIAQRWQTMCADCHSTNLKRNYDPTTTTYHTTFSEIDVSCEACHGAGSLHIELANKKSLFWDRNYGFGLAKLKGEDPEPQLQACAPCHSRRGVMDENFQGSLSMSSLDYCDHFRLETLGDATYHADGQIKDEVYVYGSFIQSKMYHKGIRCTDCHDPHSLKLKHPGNETCTSCHQHAAGKYDAVSHHHHAPGSEGAKCVNCHMPHTTYMDLDQRRDHSIRVPRPDLSVKLGTPNACSHCHVSDQLPNMSAESRDVFQDREYSQWLLAAETESRPTQEESQVGKDGETLAELIRKTDQWCDDACEKWYGDERIRTPHFAEVLVPLRNGEREAEAKAIDLLKFNDERAPAIAKATVLEEMARQRLRSTGTVANELLESPSEHPMVRAAAASVLAEASPAKAKSILVPLLKDSSRLVRVSAARALLGSAALESLSPGERTLLDRAIEEVHGEMMVANDRSGAHMSWAMVCERLQRYGEAIQAYQTAIKVEPGTTGPRSNLANLLEQQAGNVSPADQQRFLQRAAALRKQELPLLKRDALLAANLGAIQYRYGLALYVDGQLEPAMKRLQRALELEPDNQDFQLAVKLLREKMEER